jgi:mRNA interferase MazF
LVQKGEIYLVNLGTDKKGSEQMGVRPAVIIQNNQGNKKSTTTIVALLTSKKKTTKDGREYPMQVSIKKTELSEGSLENDSIILCEQIYTIDQSTRLLKKLGRISDPLLLTKLDDAVKVSLGIL